MTNKSTLLGKLPAFNNRSILIQKNQGVHDIIREVLEAHSVFASDYDKIAPDFQRSTVYETCQALFDFCKQNIRYKIEAESKQTTKSPAAILALGDSIGGDCKHYAGFIAGVLDALCRLGECFPWCYRFASYSMFDKVPQHVFVVVKDAGKEIWIDPVLNRFDDRSVMPYHTPIDKCPKKNTMPLFRISGLSEAAALYPGDLTEVVPQVEETVYSDDPGLTPEIENALRVLLYYGVMNVQGQYNASLLSNLSQKLSPQEFEKVANAWTLIQDAAKNAGAVGGFFDTLWRGVKKVTLSVPRNAYLSLVALNVFGYATKLANAIYAKGGANGTGYYQPGQQKLYDRWNSLGGDWHNLRIAIDSGRGKRPILGANNQVGVVAAVPAWVTAASAIIAAITPLVREILQSKSQAGQLDPGIDPVTGLPVGMNAGDYTGGSGSGPGILDWIEQNPVIVAAIGLGGYFLFFKKGKL
jgi:hypothetical protein